MPNLQLDIPPGIARNGTQYQTAGRWYDCNLVRWNNGALQPMAGWREFTTSDVTGKARGMLGWRDNVNKALWLAIGTHSKLYVYDSGGIRYDITPSGFDAGREDATESGGYGNGTYGSDTYGTPRELGSVTGTLPVTTWTLDTWGEYLVGCSDFDGYLYEWQLDSGEDAVAISNAPTSCTGLIVTEERFLFALGAGGNLRKVQWSDQEDNTEWTPSATNQAGDIELQTNGRIVAARRVRGGVLILTDIDAHLGRYIGPPYVYGFERVGTGCGLIGANAVAAMDVGAVWMGANGFWFFDGYVRPLPCEVAEYVFADINRLQISKVAAIHNSAYNEVQWFYPSGGSSENDRYVAWNYRENVWTIGTLGRTVGTGQGVWPRPMAVDASGNIYEHEIGYAYSGATPYVESGPIQLGAGDMIMHVRKLIPDEKTLGDVRAKFKVRDYPNSAETTHGPYTLSDETDVRFTARQVRLRLEGVAASAWRFGAARIEAVPGGKR